jgi:hypothetical protein
MYLTSPSSNTIFARNGGTTLICTTSTKALICLLTDVNPYNVVSYQNVVNQLIKSGF